MTGKVIRDDYSEADIFSSDEGQKRWFGGRYPGRESGAARAPRWQRMSAYRRCIRHREQPTWARSRTGDAGRHECRLRDKTIESCRWLGMIRRIYFAPSRSLRSGRNARQFQTFAVFATSAF